jgi:YHS domain-containing protein
MRNFLNIIALLFAVVALVSAAGCAEKTQITGNQIWGASEQVTPTVATAAPATTAPITATTSVAIPASSVTPVPSVTPAPSVTTISMKGMGSTSSKSLDPSSTVVDVVCKMEIDKNTAEFTSEYKGTTYYFCALSCKQEFDGNPEKYINSDTTEDESQEASEQVTTSETPAVTDSTDSTSSTVVDVVCKMEIDKRTAEFTSEYEGTTYYFCSADCKKEFDANPEKYVNALLEVPVATFIASPVSGNAPLNVTFTEASTGTPTSWNWNFGDGNTSIEQNPSHLYYTAGNYTVNLMVTNTNGTNSTFATITVLQPSLPITNFSSNVTRGYAPLSVRFSDLSKNATKWKWDFGDGANSTDKDPVHRYSKVGKYNVTLTVKNVNGNNKITKYSYIAVDSSKVTDVVCKMKIDKRTAELKSEYKGKTYYFCSANCKTEFNKNPEKYTS